MYISEMYILLKEKLWQQETSTRKGRIDGKETVECGHAAAFKRAVNPMFRGTSFTPVQ